MISSNDLEIPSSRKMALGSLNKKGTWIHFNLYTIPSDIHLCSTKDWEETDNIAWKTGIICYCCQSMSSWLRGKNGERTMRSPKEREDWATPGWRRAKKGENCSLCRASFAFPCLPRVALTRLLDGKIMRLLIKANDVIKQWDRASSNRVISDLRPAFGKYTKSPQRRYFIALNFVLDLLGTFIACHASRLTLLKKINGNPPFKSISKSNHNQHYSC